MATDPTPTPTNAGPTIYRLDPPDHPEPMPEDQTFWGRVLATIAGRTKSAPWTLERGDFGKAAAHALTVLVTVGPVVAGSVSVYAPQIAEFLRANHLFPWLAAFLVSFGAFAGKILSYFPQGPSAPVSADDPTRSPRDFVAVQSISLVTGPGQPTPGVTEIGPPPAD